MSHREKWLLALGVLLSGFLLGIPVAALAQTPTSTPTPAPVAQAVEISADYQSGKLVITVSKDPVHISIAKGDHVEWTVSKTSKVPISDFVIEINDQSLPSPKQMARPDHPSKGKSQSQAGTKGQENTHHPYTIYVTADAGSAAADPEVTIDP